MTTYEGTVLVIQDVHAVAIVKSSFNGGSGNNWSFSLCGHCCIFLWLVSQHKTLLAQAIQPMFVSTVKLDN